MLVHIVNGNVGTYIGDYPLGSEPMASQATILCDCTLRAECALHEEASVGCYLPICRGVTHQQAAPSGGGQKLLQGHFSVLDPSMQSDLCCYPGKQDVTMMQTQSRNEEISARASKLGWV